MTEEIRGTLTISDLKLLMDNYQNVVQLNTILLEQQKQIIELQHQLMSKQETVSSKQQKTCDSLTGVSNKLQECIRNMEKTNDAIYDACESIERSISEKIKTVGDNVNDYRVDVVKQHAGINKNVYVAWVGTGGVVIALVSLLVVVFNKFDVLNEIYEIVDQLLKHFASN